MICYMDKKPLAHLLIVDSVFFVTFNIEIAISCMLIANLVDTFVARKILAQVTSWQEQLKCKIIIEELLCFTFPVPRPCIKIRVEEKREFEAPVDLVSACGISVEFLRTQGSQSGVSVWQHTLVG